MNRYEEKKQARINRYQEHTGTCRARSQLPVISSQMRDCKSNWGWQPILVGHHSEAQARQDQKDWDSMEKSVEAGKKA